LSEVERENSEETQPAKNHSYLSNLPAHLPLPVLLPKQKLVILSEVAPALL
jgi:hypothetical protein